MNRYGLCCLVLIAAAALGCEEEVAGELDASEPEVLVSDVPCDSTACTDQGTVTTGKCHIALECPDNEYCFAPGQPMCGICMEPESTCGTDADCTEAGHVCDWVRSTTCLCGPYKSCGPRCDAEDGVPCDPDTQVCSADGHCVERTCEKDDDCNPAFACADAEGAKVCTRKTCDSVDDCDCGWCVNGSCYLEPGTCSLPVP